MKFLNTPHKKKSALITIITAILFFILFFLLGLTYYDPPISYGMEVNFVLPAKENGKAKFQKPITAMLNPLKDEDKTEEIQITKSQAKKVPDETRDVVTENKSNITIPKKKESEKKSKSDIKNPEIKPKKPQKKEARKISKATKNTVSNLLKNKNIKVDEIIGEVNASTQGDMGKPKVNPYLSSFYDNSGVSGSEKGYGLNGRNLQSNGKVIQECNQEGTVVVRIYVNNQGNVISAEPGVKGSTSVHPCLLEPAKKTALLHRWNPDNKAPLEQVGFVVIQFKLGE